MISSIWHRIKTEHITTLLLVGILFFVCVTFWYGIPWVANEIKAIRKDDKETAAKALVDEKESARLELERYQLTHDKDQLRIVEALREGNEKTAAAIRENSDSLKDLAREVKVFTDAYRDSLRQPQPPRSP